MLDSSAQETRLPAAKVGANEKREESRRLLWTEILPLLFYFHLNDRDGVLVSAVGRQSNRKTNRNPRFDYLRATDNAVVERTFEK